jgi:hypothetical protein
MEFAERRTAGAEKFEGISPGMWDGAEAMTDVVSSPVGYSPSFAVELSS